MDKEEKKKIEIEVVGLAILIGIVVLWPVIVRNIQASSYYSGAGDFLYQAGISIKWLIGQLTGIALVVSVFFVIVIVYCVEGLKVIRKKEKLMYDTKTEPAYKNLPESGDLALAHRWNSVIEHISSGNLNDWKQAIIDADIILDDILTKMGYQGESVGEKLKRVDQGDMKSIRDAWDAHMVRNRIAHEGSAFNMNQIEAQQTINQYKKVFEEFFYI
jgi:uncharacterized membrane protein